MTPRTRRENSSSLETISFVASGMVALLAIVVISGWTQRAAWLERMSDHLGSMKLNVAVAFLLASVALGLRIGTRRGNKSSVLAVMLAIAVLGIGVVTLAEIVFKWEAGIDQLIISDWVAGSMGVPGRMAPPTALAISALGGALLIVRSDFPRSVWAFQTLALLAFAIGFFGLVGHLHGASEFYRVVGYNLMAIPTALGLLLLSGGILFARSEVGFMQVFSSDLMGGRMARRVWAPTVGIVLLAGSLIQWGDRMQWYTVRTAEAIFAVANVAIFSVAIWVSSRALNRAHSTLRRRSHLQALLSQTNQSIVRLRNREDLLNEIGRIVIEFGGFRAASILLFSKESRDVELVVQSGDGSLMSVQQEAGERALREQQTVVTNDLTRETHTLNSTGKTATGSQAAFPFQLVNRQRGALVVDSAETNFFQQKELQLLQAVCADLTSALDAMIRETQRLATEEELHESRTRLELASTAANIGFWDWDLAKDRVSYSSEWKRQLGYGEAEISEGRTEWLERAHPDDHEHLANRMRELQLKRTSHFEAEFRLRHKDGGYRWMYSLAQTVGGEAKEPKRMVGWQVDITARKLAEESLRESEGRLKTVMENLREGLVISDLSGQVLHFNRAALDVHGFQSAERWLKPLPDFADVIELTTLAGEIIPFEQWPLPKILRGEKVIDQELRVRRLDIPWTRILSCGGALVQETQYSLAFLTLIDVTERTLAAQAVQESETRFREMTDHINEVFWITNPEKSIAVYISPAYEKIWGRSVAGIYANLRDWLEAVHPADRDRVQLAAETKQEAGEYDETYRVIRPDGSLRWVRDRAFPVRDEKGHIYRIVGTALDVTAAKLAEAREQLQHAVTEILAEGKPLGETGERILRLICTSLEWSAGELWTMDRATNSLRLSAAATAEAELKDFRSEIRDLTFAPGAGMPGQIWQEKQPHWFDRLATEPAFHRKQEAAAGSFDTAFGFPVGMRETIMGVCIFYGRKIPRPDGDVLALAENVGRQMGQSISRERTEEQFRQSQKMEAIGQLAGGVAHDFNNLLTVIKAYPQLMLMSPRLPAESREWLQQISSAADRAAGLTRQLLAFSRKQVMKIAPLDLNAVVEGLGSMLRRIIGEDLGLKLELAPGLPQVDADVGMIEQVVVNLVVNARDAMTSGGQLFITTGREAISESVSAQRVKSRAGNFVWCSVRDTGCGMSAETMSHIFEPFFTTKSSDQGTGLGLSTVYGIVEQHRGWVEVESSVGHGSTLTVFLPESLGRPTKEKEETVKSALRRGHVTILLVEDEPAVRMLSRIVLQRLGYHVLEASSGVAALEVWARRKNEIDLLITDMVMPQGVNGRDLAESLRRENPQLRVLFTTGYSPAHVAGALVLEEGRNFVQKPYVPQVLEQAISQCLEQPPQPLT